MIGQQPLVILDWKASQYAYIYMCTYVYPCEFYINK